MKVKKKTIEKEFYLNNLGEKVLNKFNSRLFSVKNLDKIPTREPIPELVKERTKNKKSKLKLQQEFMNEIIADGKGINDETLWNYFHYQNPSFLAEYFIRANQAKSEQLVNSINDVFIDLRNAINRKEIPENENSNKIVDIVKKIVDFNKQQKSKGIEIRNNLTPKQILEIFPIVLSQVKSGNASENFLNEIR